MLPKCYRTINQRSLLWWKFIGSQIFLTKQFVYWACADRAQEHSLGIHPTAFHLLRTAADENWPRSAERNQFVSIHGQIIRLERSSILEKISRHPVILGRGSDVFDLLPKFPAKNFCTAFAG